MLQESADSLPIVVWALKGIPIVPAPAIIRSIKPVSHTLLTSLIVLSAPRGRTHIFAGKEQSRLKAAESKI
jgi:hypothetical protein